MTSIIIPEILKHIYCPLTDRRGGHLTVPQLENIIAFEKAFNSSNKRGLVVPSYEGLLMGLPFLKNSDELKLYLESDEEHGIMEQTFDVPGDEYESAYKAYHVAYAKSYTQEEYLQVRADLIRIRSCLKTLADEITDTSDLETLIAKHTGLSIEKVLEKQAQIYASALVFKRAIPVELIYPTSTVLAEVGAILHTSRNTVLVDDESFANLPKADPEIIIFAPYSYVTQVMESGVYPHPEGVARISTGWMPKGDVSVEKAMGALVGVFSFYKVPVPTSYLQYINDHTSWMIHELKKKAAGGEITKPVNPNRAGLSLVK